MCIFLGREEGAEVIPLLSFNISKKCKIQFAEGYWGLGYVQHLDGGFCPTLFLLESRLSPCEITLQKIPVLGG